jgi:hypothetical protein
MVASWRASWLENVSYSPSLPAMFIVHLRSYRFELSLGWYGDYDGNDLAALTLLSHGPPVSTSIGSRALC